MSSFGSKLIPAIEFNQLLDRSRITYQVNRLNLNRVVNLSFFQNKYR